MVYLADLHLHSHFSRATSKDLDLENLAYWAQLKGVRVVGTADFTHPGWFAELREKLVEAEPGLFKLRPEFCRHHDSQVLQKCRAEVRFVLTVEISSIYKKGDRTRKVHNVIFAPSFPAAAKLAAALSKIGNIASDGRPILGLDCRSLLELVLKSDPDSFLVPAHIWTPHFAVLGAASGFDSLEECFEDLTDQIFAVETGLSSDPPMNWRVSALDRYTLVSNSDAHSPAKLMREANIFDAELSYFGIRDAWRSPDSGRWLGTVEFFPEEGKYHLDGHRACQQRLTPAQTRSHDGLCPACGKKVTIGVLHRVELLSDRPEGFRPAHARPYRWLVPLPEVLSEIFQQGAESKRVQAEYFRLLEKFGNEFTILAETPLDDLALFSSPLLATALGRIRGGQVTADAGYDGEYGKVRTLTEGDRAVLRGQLELFASKEQVENRPSRLIEGLNPAQRHAVQVQEGPLLILAGAGSGKTAALTRRLAYLILERRLTPPKLLAVTFTRKAAQEIRERLDTLLGSFRHAQGICIATLHSVSASLLRESGMAVGVAPDFTLADAAAQFSMVEEVIQAAGLAPRLAPAEILESIAFAKCRCGPERAAANAPAPPNGAARASGIPPDLLAEIFAAYQARLAFRNALDFEDLILRATQLFQHPEAGPKVRARFTSVLVDEAQDLNEAQYAWLLALTADHQYLTLVGDPDQSIYSFRGANARIFDRFLADFPRAARISLEENYRCPDTVLAVAEKLIAADPNRFPKRLFTRRTGGRKVQLWTCDTSRTEAARIVQAIEEMVGETSMERRDAKGPELALSGIARGFSDVAILTRTHAQHTAIIEGLKKAGIPFQAAAASRKKTRPEIKEILALLRFASSPSEDEALAHLLVARVRGLGEKTGDLLRGEADRRQCSLLDTLRAFLENPDWKPVFRPALEDFLQTTDRHRVQLAGAGLIPVLKELLAGAGLLEGPTKDPDAQFLLLLAAQYEGQTPGGAAPGASQPTPQGSPTSPSPSHILSPGQPCVRTFLSDAALRLESDLLDPRAEAVLVLTIHAAKGMEFPVVFLCGIEEGLLPHAEACGCDEALNEERRLCYVGMTRAREFLVLTHCRSRLLFGCEHAAAPSRFLNSIPIEDFETRKFVQKVSRRREADKAQLRLF